MRNAHSTSGYQMKQALINAIQRKVKLAEEYAVNNLISDDNKVTDDIQAARYAICKKCPYYRIVADQCSACGCFLYAKTYMRDQVCPKEKW